MNVLGIDLSLNATGLALLRPATDDRLVAPALLSIAPGRIYPGVDRVVGNDYLQAQLISPVPEGIMQRWDAILAAVMALARHANFIVIEGYSFNSATAYATAVRELGGIVRYHLRKMGHQPIEIAPAALKKFITGAGGSDKNIVLKEIFKRYELDLSDDNLADAFGLAKIGQAIADPDRLHLLPAFQRDVVRAITTPKPPKKRKGRAA
jgi:Holliday junction resolvasome RuvABC endonuclease subunit